MRVELRVLGPVFLVLLAGYLASSVYDLDAPFEISSPTGQAISDQCSTDKILFRVSGSNNAHAALATQTQYTYAVCWDGQGATSRQCNTAGTNVVLRLSDTVNDGVFDIGLGSLVNTPCDPRVHSNLLQCADNCRTTVNADQLDTDGDGAGDVCDLFINDSCSVLVADDNCPYRQQCSNLAASWSRTSALEGESVDLTVTGSADCQGKIAHFQVFDRVNNNGQSCEDHPLCRGVPATFMVCQSDLTQSYFCLTGPSGCKVLSNPLPCSNANGVQTVCDRGAFTCRSPTCTYNRPLSPCVGGQQTRTCTVLQGGTHCSCAGYPLTETCVNSQEGENFPVFTWSNFLITIVLLIIFYSFRRGVQWKSR